MDEEVGGTQPVATQPFHETQDDFDSTSTNVVAVFESRCIGFQDKEIDNAVREIIIGRGVDLPKVEVDKEHIMLQDKRVSTKHCRVFRTDEVHREKVCRPSFSIEDLSSNGVFINGVRICQKKQTLLKSGDEVSVVTNSKRERQRGTPDKIVYAFTLTISENWQPDSVVESRTIENKYILSSRVLGNGNFSHVLVCTSRDKNERLALKVIDKKKFLNFSRCRNSGLTLKSEIDVLKRAIHPSIVRLYDVCEEPQNMYLVMELCEGGDLLQAILDNGIYQESISRRLFTEICEGLRFLHEMNIIHRDMKPENVLLTSKSPENVHAKISDFGLARDISQSVAVTFCGTPHYFAPEIIASNEGEIDSYGVEVDAWAAGVILYILLSGIPPFEDADLYGQITAGKYGFDDPEWVAVSVDAKDLVRSLMHVNHRERCTIQSALEHTWMVNNNPAKRRRMEEPQPVSILMPDLFSPKSGSADAPTTKPTGPSSANSC